LQNKALYFPKQISYYSARYVCICSRFPLLLQTCTAVFNAYHCGKGYISARKLHMDHWIRWLLRAQDVVADAVTFLHPVSRWRRWPGAVVAVCHACYRHSVYITPDKRLLWPSHCLLSRVGHFVVLRYSFPEGSSSKVGL